MNDRELLELAALAAGHDDLAWSDKCSGMMRVMASGGFWPGVWNPLTDDGDAMRLAVELNNYEPYKSHGGWRISPGLSVDQARMAIVRAAAEIGRNMQEAS